MIVLVWSILVLVIKIAETLVPMPEVLEHLVFIGAAVCLSVPFLSPAIAEAKKLTSLPSISHSVKKLSLTHILYYIWHVQSLLQIFPIGVILQIINVSSELISSLKLM